MKLKLRFAAMVLSALLATQMCGVSVLADNEEPAGIAKQATLTLDETVTYQTIEGFGFFGANDVWWNQVNPDEKWLQLSLEELGITMWRNELYPNNPVQSNISVSPQDATWEKQKPIVEALANRANELNVPLKMILTVWSPPGEWKVDDGDVWRMSNEALEEFVRDASKNTTKEGGTLGPAYYQDYGNWLVSALDMYKEIGVDIYGLSLQNEPGFREPYNSCLYTAKWYEEMLNAVVPIIREKYPHVKIFGAENMLGYEADVTSWWNRFSYNDTISASPESLSNIDVFAVHGYTDGVISSAIEKHKDYWSFIKNNHSKVNGKDAWMSETSGYTENWTSTSGKPGAFDLGIAIQSALAYGDVSAWVWWQGSEKQSNASDYNLIYGNNYSTGKKFEVSKQFYRFVRPGSVRIGTSLDANGEDTTGLLVTAYQNQALRNNVVVLVNTENDDYELQLSGQNLPDTYDYYITSQKTSDNCRMSGTVSTAGKVTIPARSVVTLVNGSIKESEINTGEDVNLNVSTDKKMVGKGDYFNVSVSFPETVKSNAAIIDLTYDSTKFSYRGYTPADGVTSLAAVNEEGLASITVMIDQYNAKDLGNVLFSAKEDVNLENKENVIQVEVSYVEKNDNGDKRVSKAAGSTSILTHGGVPGDTTGKGYVDLIDLSNIIDMFGFDTETPGWSNTYRFYDFNNNGKIDIQDIITVAKFIKR